MSTHLTQAQIGALLALAYLAVQLAHKRWPDSRWIAFIAAILPADATKAGAALKGTQS